MRQKLIASILVMSLVNIPLGFAGAVQNGDPKTNFHRVGNEGHAPAGWLVKSIGNSQQILWQDGSVTKVSVDELEAEYLDLTAWIIGAQGGSPTEYKVTYVSPTDWTSDQIVVVYNLDQGTVIGGTRLAFNEESTYNPDQLVLNEYCTENWGCA